MKTVFLIGFPGSGKTTLGEAVAQVMGCQFVDLDKYIEHHARKSITEIYRSQGEQHFRQLEQQALSSLATHNGIVACGGGTPCHPGNMELMNSHGITVWLTTAEERLISRLCLPEHRAKRPAIASLDDSEIAAYVRTTLAERTRFYSMAQLQFDSTRIEDACETAATAIELAQLLLPLTQQ